MNLNNGEPHENTENAVNIRTEFLSQVIFVLTVTTISKIILQCFAKRFNFSFLVLF